MNAEAAENVKYLFFCTFCFYSELIENYRIPNTRKIVLWERYNQVIEKFLISPITIEISSNQKSKHIGKTVSGTPAQTSRR